MAEAGPKPGASEARHQPRKLVALPVSILDAHQRTDARMGVVAANIGLDGMFVRSDLLLEVGETVALAFELPGGTRVTSRGQVTHSQRTPQADAGMGLTFVQLSDSHRRALEDFIAKLP